jgi:hypothetical protein
MIGKPEWFKRRKYGGWGIMPKTWQGWVYLAIIIIPFAIFNALPYWSVKTRIIVTGAWALFLIIDVVHIMVKMPRDERDRLHEAIAERNALWTIILVLVIGIGYQMARSAVTKTVQVDYFIIAAVFAGLIVKGISNIYLDKRN